MLKNYLKIAWRNLQRSKVTGFINVAGLAIGMAVAMMIGLWVHDELSFNRVHSNYDRIAQVFLHQTFGGEVGTSPAVSLPTGPTLRNEFGSNFDYVAHGSWEFRQLLSYENNRFLHAAMFVEPAFPEIFSLDLIYGDRATVLSEPNSVLIAESLAQSLFGSVNPVGKTVRHQYTSDLQVTGVFRDLPHSSQFRKVKFFTTWEHYKKTNPWVASSADSWGNHSFQLFVQLSEHADIEAVSNQIKDIETPHNKAGKPAYFLFPMSDWHLYSDFKNGQNIGGRIQFVWMFSIIGLFVLLLACINFMNLSTARSEKRAKEVGVRKTVGSGRSQLIYQFLSESFLLTFIAMVFSILLVQLSLSWFNELADKDLSVPWRQPLFYLTLVGFAGLTGLLAGSYPAFYLSSFEPLRVLKGTFKVGKGATTPRKVLVTLQFTVSISLIIGTMVVFQQIQHAKNRPVGYDRSGLLYFFNNAELDGKSEVLRNELTATGLIEEVSYSSSPITNIWSNQIGFDWEGKDPNAELSFGFVTGSHEFGKTIGWQIKEGRDFDRAYATDTVALMLNESAVRQTGLTDIVGKTIEYSDVPHTVVGVIKDMIMESPWYPIKPTIFRLNSDWLSVYNVRLKPGVPVQDAVRATERVFTSLSPSTPFDYQFVDQEYDQKFEAEERIGKLARVFALLAIFISCLGLFGLSAFVAEQRTKEIGIRKVLGASVANLWALQSKNFLLLVVVSALIAAPVSWYFLENWLTGYDYRISINVAVFLLAGSLAVLVTLLTVSYQSIRAATASPIHSLKTE